MRRSVALILLGGTLCLPSMGLSRKPLRSFADPSTIAAAQIALNRLAREKGQWMALRDTASEDAVMFVPEKVIARDWLKGRPSPADPVQWNAQKIYLSCDGRTAAATGTWKEGGGASGAFTTIWRLDDKGRWQWALEHRGQAATAQPDADFLEGHVAKCRNDAAGAQDRPAGRGEPLFAPGRRGGGKKEPPKADDSLLWNYEAGDAGGSLRVRMWDGSAYRTVIDDKVGAK